MKVKEENEKAGLTFCITKTNIMASGSVTSVGTSLGLLIRRHSLGNADLTLALHLTNGVRKA